MTRRLLLLLTLVFCVGMAVPAQQNRNRQQQTQRRQQQTQRRQQPQQRRQQQTRQRQQQPSQREKLQQQQQQLRQQREANQRRKRELESQVQERMRDVLALGTEINDKQAVIDSLQSEVLSTDSCITLLNEQLKQLQAELEERQQRYIRSMRYMYRTRHAQNQMMFILSAQNFNQMFRRIRFTREYATYQRAQGEAVKQKREQTEQKQRELSAARDHQAALLSRGQHEKQELALKQQQQQQMVEGLKKEQQTVQQLIARQQQQEAELDACIDQLIQEEIAAAQRRAEEEQRQRDAAEARRRQQQEQAHNNRNGRNQQNNRGSQNRRNNQNRNNHNNGRNNRRNQQRGNDQLAFNESAADRRFSTSFSSQKGRLPAPITGSYRIIRGFGRYQVEGLRNVELESKGIHLQGQAGAQARCVYDGEVSGIFNRDGIYVVMVRHGRYISAYFNLASVNVSKGQQVRAKQILGTVASDHIMQFRLQNGFTLLNPRAWIAR